MGAVIVSTPQDLALIDATRAIELFDSAGVPVIGVVENMAIHVCPQCGHTQPIFGEGGGQRMAEQYQAPCLGSLPLTLGIREQTDRGQPTVVADPNSEAAHIYCNIARKLAAHVATLPRDLSAKFPPIVVQTS